MSQTLAPADVAHHDQRLAELSTLPFRQLPDSGEPSGTERGHVWHWQDIYPELARSRDIAAGAAVLQRRALIFCKPRARHADGRHHPHDRGGLPDALPRRERPRPRPFHVGPAVRSGWQRSSHEPQMPVCWEVS